MLILAVFPCCAIDDCPDDKIKTEQSSDHQAGDEDCGSCSPFFNCEQCTTATVTIETIYLNCVLLAVKQVYSDFNSPSIPDPHYDFWQPPKLG